MQDLAEGRQLPRKQFLAEFNKHQRPEARQHARWAGCQLAEVLVSRRVDLEQIPPTELERYRKAYGVYKWQMKSFLTSCKRAIPFEKAWQYTP